MKRALLDVNALLALLDSDHSAHGRAQAWLDGEIGGISDRTRLHGPRRVTDAYLLALVGHNEGRLVTFDRSVPIATVLGAELDDVAVL